MEREAGSERPREPSPEYEAPDIELVMDREELGREVLHAVVLASDLT